MFQSQLQFIYAIRCEFNMKEISSLFKYHWGLIPILSLILVQVGIGPVEGFPAVADGQTEAENKPSEGILFIREELNDTKYLVLDDMIIAKDPSRAGLLNAAWPNGMIPFTYAMTIAPQQRLMISQAMSEIAAKTCLQFRPKTNSDEYWLLFQNDPMNQGCSSYVGWQNRKNQMVQLSNSCSKGNAIHEIIHAAGFFHEQTRDDRDSYVTVHLENVQPGYENNFKKESDMDPPPESSSFNVPYNYDSIMHYGKNYFSKNGQPTIVPLNNPAASGNGDNIGQRDFISPGDVDMLNNKYNCPTLEQVDGDNKPSTTPKPTQPANPGANNPMCQFQPSLPICKLRLEK